MTQVNILHHLISLPHGFVPIVKAKASETRDGELLWLQKVKILAGFKEMANGLYLVAKPFMESPQIFWHKVGTMLSYSQTNVAGLTSQFGVSLMQCFGRFVAQAHGIKFYSVVTPDGLFACYSGEWSLVQWLQVLDLCGEDVGLNPAMRAIISAEEKTSFAPKVGRLLGLSRCLSTESDG